MNEHDIHEIIFKHICKEISMIADQIQKKGSMTEQDLDRLDKLYHTKKDMLTAKAMTKSEEYGENDMNGNSGYRGRSPMTGRYVSRESYSDGYNSGYNNGYSQAMDQMRNSGNNGGGNSGHYPPMPYPYPERNW